MNRSIFKSTSVVGLITLLSRISGMVRDVAQANLFGGGPVADAFLVAYKIPNFLRRLFAEGAFSQSFVPVVTEYKHRKDHHEVEELINGTAGTLGLLLFIIRAYANYPEGCSFAILFMNVCTPLIDRFTAPHPFGEVKKHG